MMSSRLPGWATTDITGGTLRLLGACVPYPPEIVRRPWAALVEVYDGISSLGLGQVEGLVSPRDQGTNIIPRLPPARSPAEGEASLFAVGQYHGVLAQVLDDALQHPLSRLSFCSGKPP
jgi:hypothetical protein